MSENAELVFIQSDAQIVWAQGADAAEFHRRAVDAPFSGSAIVAGHGAVTRKAPCPPVDPADVRRGVVPGLWQDRPAARMHGEETVIAGFLSETPDFDGISVVTGPEQTVWAHISAGEVVSFQGFLSSRIARALGCDPAQAAGDDFETALAATLSRPERLAAHLASAQAAGTGQENAHLIGAELAAARPYWLGQRVALLTDGSSPYAAALAAQGIVPETASRLACAFAGLRLCAPG